MATIETWFKQDLWKPVPVNGLGILSNADTYRIGVACYRGKKQKSLTGSIKGFIFRPDKSEVSFNGSISGNTALITLPNTAFDYSGRIAISIKNIDNNVTTTLCNVVAFV